MKTPRSIEIIGGGLAGLSLGLALRRAGVPVTLHEAGSYPRHRVCGEFITALDSATRAQLGLDEFLSDAIHHHEVAWFRRAAPLLRHPLPSPALALGRHALDIRLADAFRTAGGDLHEHSRIDPRAAPPGCVFAQGRRPAHGSPWLGLKCHALGLATTAPLEVHLGAHAYVGLCAIGENRVNISGLFRRRPGLALDRASALPAYLRAAGLDALADRLAAVEIDPESRCAVAGLAFGRAAPAPREEPARLSLGDAHALIPPFTGNGMTMAFQSAALALAPLLAWTHGEQTWPETVSHVQRLLSARFRLRLASSALLHPAMLDPRGQAGLSVAAHARLLPVRSLYHALH
jgi:2-polyprenyl-6-methoxyphenol hydroxylase-like FAD-dependent oxidoreductase